MFGVSDALVSHIIIIIVIIQNLAWKNDRLAAVLQMKVIQSGLFCLLYAYIVLLNRCYVLAHRAIVNGLSHVPYFILQ